MSLARDHGIRPGAFFWRTHAGAEVDLLIRSGRRLVAIEIKLSAYATPQDLARLERAADLVSAEHRYVVCQTAEPAASGTRGALDLASAIERLKRIGRARR